VNKLLAPIASLVAASYCALAIVALTCLFDQPDSRRVDHHHHQGSMAHSSFCAWACQTSPTSAIVATAPSIRPLLLVQMLPVSLATVLISVVPIFIPARAPPR
jgi:hypothetical protein